jgi:hypothetical protein
MEDLIQQIVTKTGITEQQAIDAVHTMKDYIISKVPPMFSGFVDNFFTGTTIETEEDPLA